MEIEAVCKYDPEWQELIDYIAVQPWGRSLGVKMKEEEWKDWERVIIAREEGNICGFCTAVENDNMEDLTYSPFIGYVYVNEQYRGNRISEKMIRKAEEIILAQGYHEIHIMSGHVGLYEKYGYVPSGEAYDTRGRKETVFARKF